MTTWTGWLSAVLILASIFIAYYGGYWVGRRSVRCPNCRPGPPIRSRYDRP
jgi:hypothetical protein